MKEKKLTDEEIIKAFEYCNYKARDCGCTDCPYSYCVKDDIRCRMKQMRIDTLDLIKRLQAENERLTEELEIEKHNHKATKWHFDNSYKEGLRLLEANKELVREVDKLRDMKFAQEHFNLYEENKWLKECLQQAVKDTAKEIIADVKNCMRCFEDDDDGYLLKKCEFEFFMREIAKRKGVEVE